VDESLTYAAMHLGYYMGEEYTRNAHLGQIQCILCTIGVKCTTQLRILDRFGAIETHAKYYMIK
jgi:hypothetical protein